MSVYCSFGEEALDDEEKTEEATMLTRLSPS